MIETKNVPGLPEPAGYTHVAIATGSKTVYLAGQVARGENGELVGEGDLAAQVEQVVVNVHAALGVAGATLADVAKTTIYVVDWEPAKMEAIFDGVMRAAQRVGGAVYAPATMVGVAALAEPGLLVEFDVTAVID